MSMIAAIGFPVIGWVVSKVCDGGVEQVTDILNSTRLQPNEDLERAILTAHFDALAIVLEPFKGPCAINAQSALKERRNQLDEILKDSASFLAEKWQEVAKLPFSSDNEGQMPPEYIDAAVEDMRTLPLNGWEEDEWEEVKKAAAENASTGWSWCFISKFRGAIKAKDSKARRYLQTQLLVGIHDIVQKLDRALEEIGQKLERMEGTLDSVKEDTGEILSWIKSQDNGLKKIEDALGADLEKVIAFANQINMDDVGKKIAGR
ncbi:MAG: hypothetical protein ACWA5L_07180 [bacterium]